MFYRLNTGSSGLFVPSRAWGLLVLVVLIGLQPWIVADLGGTGSPHMQPLSRQRFEVDINRATLPELRAIPSIGPKMAERIDDYRSLHGPFSQVEDLLQVRGIGENLLEKMRPHLRVGSKAGETVVADNLIAIE